MFLALDVWLLPAIAAGSASYLVSLAWERIRPSTAPTPLQSGYLAALSFVMGSVCSYYRHKALNPTPENNIIAMFIAGTVATFAWLCLRKYLPGLRQKRGD